MTYIPSPQRTSDQKLKGEFYPLQKQELIALKQAKLINNVAYVHFALRFENPFCDRPLEIIPKEFALRWGIPEVSVYKAITKLKELAVVNIKSGKVVIEWASETKTELSQPEVELSQPEPELSNVKNNIGSDNGLSDPKMDYQIGKKIIKIDKKLSDPIKDYQIGKNRVSKSAPEAKSGSPQTLQTYSDFTNSLSEEEGEKFLDFVEKDIKDFNRPIRDIKAWLASKTKAGENRWQVYYQKFKQQRERTLKRPSLSQEIEERRQRILAQKRAESGTKTDN